METQTVKEQKSSSPSPPPTQQTNKPPIPKVVVTQPSNGNFFPRASVASSYGSDYENYEKNPCCCCSIL